MEILNSTNLTLKGKKKNSIDQKETFTSVRTWWVMHGGVPSSHTTFSNKLVCFANIKAVLGNQYLFPGFVYSFSYFLYLFPDFCT